jgi:hypothetical protein
MNFRRKHANDGSFSPSPTSSLGKSGPAWTPSDGEREPASFHSALHASPIHSSPTAADCKRRPHLTNKLLREPSLTNAVEVAVEGSATAQKTAGFGDTMVHINELVEQYSANMVENEMLDVPDEIKLFMKVCLPLGQRQCHACL